MSYFIFQKQRDIDLAVAQYFGDVERRMALNDRKYWQTSMTILSIISILLAVVIAALVIYIMLHVR
jgi:hypothetical protein